MKKYILMIPVAFFFIAAKTDKSAQTVPHTATQQDTLRAHGQEWRQQMNVMLNDLSGRSTEPATDMFGNTLNKDQGKRILEGIKALKSLDKGEAFKTNLNELERLTKLLLGALKSKNEIEVQQYSEDIFNTCFTCHQERKMQGNQE